MSTTTPTAWPTPISLPGQAAAHEGPVDMTVMYLMHFRFRTDLEKLALAAQRTPVTDRATWRLLAKRWGTFSTVLHHHHSGEDDGLWPWLLEHGTEEDRATLEAMEAEHADIDPALQACAAGFARLAEHADEDARAALAVRLTATRESLGRHLRHEESDAIAIIQRVMTAEDWQRIDEEFFVERTTPRLAALLVPWVGHGLPAEVRDPVLAAAPLPFRVLWRLTHRRFDRVEARTFRYVDGEV